jgi:CMP-N,N'-diacetyllegionaminic acid synthase
MTILAIIPARGGSKGVPGKNIKLLGGQPLIQYTIDRALESQRISKVIVSSEDTSIIKIAQDLGASVPFVRPEHLATDTASSISVVQHAIDYFEKEGVFFDVVCLLQATYPFREAGFIDKAIEKFIESGVDSLISVLPVPHEFNPHWVFEVNDKEHLILATGEDTIITRRQDLPKAYHRDGALYLTKTKCIKAGTFYGNTLGYIETPPHTYVNIDTLNDWEKAEELLKFKN